MKIAGIQKSSLIDYPHKIAAVVFLQGCNFRCPFCHNAGLLDYNAAGNFIKIEELTDFLKKRKNKLDAVVISGGEPTLHSDLDNLIAMIKSMGYLVKLDTNGTNPKMLKSLAWAGMLNYVAMDIKAPLEKYAHAVNSPVILQNIKESIEFLKNNQVDYEFRTTVVREELNYEDFKKIAQLINGAKKYCLQKFIPENAAEGSFKNKHTYTEEEFFDIKELFKNYVCETLVR